MFLKKVLVTGIMLAFGFSAFAGPQISVKNEIYDAGEMLEGSKDHIRHKFAIKNVGDSVLHISKVKAG